METNNNMTFEEVMKVWRNTEDLIKPFLRRLAANRLIIQGFEEVGTSDINLELYHMFQEYGSFMDCYDQNIYPEKPFIWEQ
jgi:hypothetical protein